MSFASFVLAFSMGHWFIMNLTRRRASQIVFTLLGAFMIALAVTLNITWIHNNSRRFAMDVVGVLLFAVLIAGVVLNTIFLLREIRRNERQDSFLNAVTHELKTPIASIRLYLDTLERRPVDDAQRAKFLAIMRQDTDRLLLTVESVLKAGELGQRGSLSRRSRVDLFPLVAESVHTILSRHGLPPDAIELVPVGGGVRLIVLGNADDLRSAVLNVLDNAVKYSPERVRIHVRLAIERYTWATLSVTDTGVGLDPRELRRIFRRFYRVGGRAQDKIKGTGLGLFLVRTIAKQHNGSVRAFSPGPGQGTTITLRLPLAHGLEPDTNSTEAAA